MRKWTAILALFALAISAISAPTFSAPPPSQPTYNCNLNAGTQFKCQVPATVAGWYDSVAGYFKPAGNDYPLPISGTVTISDPVGSDACQNPANPKSSVALNISTATTTELVAASLGKVVYVCSVNFTTGGTTPTYQFKTGTKVSSACDTTPANLSGAMAPLTGLSFMLNPQGVMMQSITSGEICLTTGGTTPAALGFMTYVQI